MGSETFRSKCHAHGCEMIIWAKYFDLHFTMMIGMVHLKKIVRVVILQLSMLHVDFSTLYPLCQVLFIHCYC